MADGRIVIDTILNKEPAEKGFSNLQKSLQTAAGKTKQIGKNMTTYLTAPLVAFGGAAMVAANDLDKAYANIRAGTGATGEDLESLKQSFKNVFENVPQSADEVSRALADLNTRTGLVGEPLEKLTKQFLDLSRVSGVEATALIRDATRVFGDWSIETENQAESLDYLWKVSQNTGIGIDRLSQQMVQFGAPLRQMGFGFEESAALLAKFEKEGVNAELVMGSMRIALGNMAREGIDAREGLQQTMEAIKNAGSESEANAIAMEMFGARAGPDMAAAIREGRFEIDDLIATLETSDETIQKAGEETMTFGERMAMLKNQVQIGLEPVGRILIDLAEKWLPPVINLVQQVAEWFANLSPAGQMVIFAIGGIVAVIGPLLGMFSMVVSAISTLMPLFAALTGPVGLVIAAIAALIAIGVLLWKNWDTIKEKAREFGQAIKDRIQEMRDRVKERIRNMINSALEWFESLRQKAVEKVTKLKDRGVAIFHEMWNGIKSFFLSILKGGLLGLINDYILKPFFDIDLFQIGKDIINGLWRGISSMAGTLKKNIERFINKYVPGPVKKILGIASPSKLFMELGEDTGEGFEIGLAKSMRSIVKQAENLAQAAIPDIKPGLASLGTANHIQTINNMRGLLEGATFVVREDADIDRITERVGETLRQQADWQIRALGGV
ncbi:phage tail tape measure protein, TP901 family [Caldalkalibacillus thermarum TA2.A1]|uniref:Phage tail tape measure protein, TP901 family n=1 Tax=Caldalkalibacillus thermarum (strain TA2.A1) TaxID=986075 RepID=F5L4J2_CALTT|nr:phage tail tape measure protein [Caldalkalibacillus thermarum]EGL83738.1 phage tail tape measure protein, TP901 family [Caldalkalibacillus thermarum TA2.A1]